MEKLYDWTSASNDSIKFYSGKAVYSNHFDLTTMSDEETIFLNLGKLSALAIVKINGKEVGGVWTAPWKIDISNFVNAGKNSVEISVVNTWANRLIGDSHLPAKVRPTWCTVNPYKSDSELHPSGLLGPVSVEAVKY